MSETQSAASHAKMVPLFHYVAFGLLFIPTVWFLKEAAMSFSMGNLMSALFCLGVLVLFWFTRVFPLGVQDRVIRLEERLRMERVLPTEMHARIEEISTDMLIGLRFAPDDELTDLTRRVLSGELADRKAVKNAIRAWRADYQRI